MPKLKDRHYQETHKSTETHKYVIICFPHFGNVFGLTEDASKILLLEMVLMTMLKGVKQESYPKNGMIFVQIFKTNDLELSMQRCNEVFLYLVRLVN